nr:golgin subfamily A member 8B-like [Anolis sagrei ordinatus]
MSTKGKAEKEKDKELQTQTQLRRGSLDRGVNMENILKEIKKLSEKQDAMKKDMTDKQEEYYKKQEEHYKKLDKDLKDMKKEMKEEFGELKKELNNLAGEVEVLKAGKIETDETQAKIMKKIKSLEKQKERMELEQEKLLQKQMDYQLRLRNMQEDSKEDIRSTVLNLLARVLEVEEDELEQEVDQIY